MNTNNCVPRIQSTMRSNAIEGIVKWDKAKSFWFSAMALIALMCAPATL